MNALPVKTLNDVRFEALRNAMVAALCEASVLLRHEVEGNYLYKEDVYHKLVEINRLLASGLYEGTQP